MSDAPSHDVMAIELEDGVPTDPVDEDVLRSGLESDDDRVRSQAATVAAGLATEDSEAVEDLLETFFDLLGDDSATVVYQSATALALLAEDAPDRFEPGVEPLVDLLDHDLPLVRMLAARALALVAIERPEYLTDQVDRLVDATARTPEDVVDESGPSDPDLRQAQRESLREVNREGRSQQIVSRQITANLLVEVAEHDPAVVAPRADAFVDLLADEDADVAVPATRVVAALAERDPESVADARDPLVDLLSHPDDTVVANAVQALGFLGDESAVEPLRALAEGDDRDPDLQAMAAETADFLAGQ